MSNFEEAIKDLAIIVGLVLSLWNFFSPYFRRMKLEIIPEQQIQLMCDGNAIGFNVLNTIISYGPGAKAVLVRFEEAKIHFPEIGAVTFKCRAYLEESGIGQKSLSRNVTIVLRGDDVQSITPAFQNNDVKEWKVGKYGGFLFAKAKKVNKTIEIPIKFSLSSKDLSIIARPKAILTKSLD